MAQPQQPRWRKPGEGQRRGLAAHRRARQPSTPSRAVTGDRALAKAHQQRPARGGPSPRGIGWSACSPSRTCSTGRALPRWRARRLTRQGARHRQRRSAAAPGAAGAVPVGARSPWANTPPITG